jgi:hypothetical protein
MTKYLTTFEDLKNNIDKKLRFNDGKKIVEGYMQNFGAGNIVLRKTRNFNDWISIGKNTPIQKIKILEIELIEEDNKSKEEDNKEYICQVDKDAIMEQSVKPNDNNYNPDPKATYYHLVINDRIVDVNMILEAISKNLEGKCDLMMWAYFTNTIEYLLRSFFKGQQELDLIKAKKNIEFMINKLGK